MSRMDAPGLCRGFRLGVVETSLDVVVPSAGTTSRAPWFGRRGVMRACPQDPSRVVFPTHCDKAPSEGLVDFLFA